MAFNSDAGGNSYCSVDFAGSYFELSFHGAEKWDAVDDKESALATASSLLDWYNKFLGTKEVTTNILHFPTSGFTATNGEVIESGEIPYNIKIATCELALYNIDTDRVADNALAGVSKLKAGPLSLEATGSGSDSTTIEPIPDHVSRIVKPYVSIYGSMGVVRLVRG